MPAVIIEGTFENWSGEVQRLEPPCRDPQEKDAFWFGAQSGDKEIWFRLTSEAIERMREAMRGIAEEHEPRACGDRLIHALIAWCEENSNYEWAPRNCFQAYVSDTGDTIVSPWQSSG